MSNAKKDTINRLLFIQQVNLLEFRKKLLTWYANNGRNLPWRRPSVSKYKLVISELLLQRTKAEMVANFFSTFINRYPSWKKLSEASELEISLIIKPIGLWKRRSTVFKQLAMVVVKKKGRFPRIREELEALPGIGQYIANAILLFCHGEAQPLLDTNMARVLERVFGPRKLADIRYDAYLQDLAFEIVQCKDAKELNWAILDLAASNCFPRKPRCKTCPLEEVCLSVSKDLNIERKDTNVTRK
jgi:A/G-specific adenine glycosylase